MTDISITNSFYISNRDKSVGDDDANFEVKLRHRESRIKRISIEYAQIQHGWYPILVGFNDRVDFTDGTNTYFIIIPEGSYSSSKISSTLTSLMNAVAPPIAGVITVNILSGTNNGKMQFNISAATISMLFSDASSTNSLRDVLGYRAHVNTVPAVSILGDSIVNLNADVEFIDICSDSISKFTTKSSSTTALSPNLIMRMPISTSFGGSDIYIPRVPRFIDFNDSESFGKVQITLRRPNGKILNLNGGFFGIALTFWK